MKRTIWCQVVLIGIAVLGIVGCARVPREAVQLSYAVGDDIVQLHAGYRRTIKFSFDQARQRGLAVIENTWIPAYLAEFVMTGELVESAQGGQLDRVEFWARLAIDAIDSKRQEFLGPLEQQEEALVAEVDEAFDRLIRANSAVTAHLNSVLKVQDIQDDIADSVGLRDIRDRVSAAIATASEYTDTATDEIEAGAGKLQ